MAIVFGGWGYWEACMTEAHTRSLYFSKSRCGGATKAGYWGAVALMAAIGVSGLPNTSNAQSGKGQSASLEGSWSGGGSVTFFSSGGAEQARCRARYSRVSNVTYALSATCATASARASQTATLRKISENTYRGSFHNAEYDVSGSIYVVVRGNSQSVTLTSAQGGGKFQLSRAR